MERSPGRFGVMLVALVGLGTAACGGGGGSDLSFAEVGGLDGSGEVLSMDVPPDRSAPDAPPPDGHVCWPDTVGGCSLDERGLLVCLPDGSGFTVEACASISGGPGRCLNGACTRCVPGERFCRAEDQVWRCDDTGQGYDLLMDCDGARTGQVCTLGTCTRLCDLAQKWDSYLGCDYWGADLDNAFVDDDEDGYLDAQGKPYAIVVSNPHASFPATVTIERFDEASGTPEPVLGSGWDDTAGWSDPFPADPIGPGELRVFKLPRRDVNGTVIAPLAYHVRASIPVTAYQFNPLDNEKVYSNDASLLLPSNVYGSWYYVMTREQTFVQLRSYLTVIAVQSGETTVEVRVTAPTLPGPGLPRMQAGDSGVRTLRQYDVWNIETDAIGADMTGAEVKSSKTVAVFGGSEASNAPNDNHCTAAGVCAWDGESPCEGPGDCMQFNTCCADHLEQQLFPVKTWGKHYLCAKSFDRGLEQDVWRVIASEQGTQVTTFPPVADIPVLDAGEWFEFESDLHFEMLAKKPVMVGQFLAAQDAPTPGKQEGDAGIGDPAFILVVPAEQFRTDYVFLAPDKYAEDYATVVAPKAAAVHFDGAPLDPGLWSPLGAGDWRVARFAIADGTHTITADQPVGVYVYGYDRYVSYGYPAGLDLRPINPVNPTLPTP